MGAFAIKIYEFAVGDRLYVGEDERLWDWLNNAPIFLTINEKDNQPEDTIRVLCPEGYVFYDGMLLPLESNLAIYPPEPKLSDFGYIRATQMNLDKILLLVLSPYTKVTRSGNTEPKTIGIEDDRIFEITI